MTATGPDAGAPPGLAAERTRLAWRRTALALTVVALLALRECVRRGGPVGLAGTALAVPGWLAGMRLCQRRIRAMAQRVPEPPGTVLPALACLVAVLALLGGLLVALG